MRLLKAIPKTPTLTKAMLVAGYSPETARAKAKRTTEMAIRSAQARAAQGNQEALVLLRDKVGITKERLMERYRYLIEDSRNEAVSLKAMEPLLAEEAIRWDMEKQQQTLPPVNIAIIPNTPQTTENTPMVAIDGPTEPQK